MCIRDRINSLGFCALLRLFNKNDIDQFKDDADGLMKFLRTETYKLSPDKNKNYDVGFDFET